MLLSRNSVEVVRNSKENTSPSPYLSLNATKDEPIVT